MEYLTKFKSYAFTILTIILLIAIISSGKYESYYIQRDNTASSVTVYCVYGNVDWRPDPKVYCSEEFPRILMLNSALNGQNMTVQTPKTEVVPPTTKTEMQ